MDFENNNNHLYYCHYSCALTSDFSSGKCSNIKKCNTHLTEIELCDYNIITGRFTSLLESTVSKRPPLILRFKVHSFLTFVRYFSEDNHI